VHLSDAGVPGTLTLLEPTGPDTYAFVDTALGQIVLRVAGHVSQRVGDGVHLSWDARDLHVFDAVSEARIG
jgi:multiple sugar transport system ATP-binding protein